MRTHSAIIIDGGGPAAIARRLNIAGVTDNNVKAWRRLNSIPAPYWWPLSKLGVATLKELAIAVAKDLGGEDTAERPRQFPACSSIVAYQPLFLLPLSQCSVPADTRIGAFFSGQPAGEMAARP